jgi:hypothetical protein
MRHSAILLLSVLSGVLLAAPASAKPRLLVQPAAGTNQVIAEVDAGNGQVRRSVVRATPSPVVPGATGSDPANRASFVTWNEGGERWFAVTRDGGKSWTEAEATETALRLHAGSVEPGRPMPAVPESLALPRDGRLYLVQFRTLGLPEWRDALREAGAEVLSYFHSNAHIVRLDPSQVKAVQALELVERVEPYHPYYRLQPELRDWLSSPASGKAQESVRVNAMAFEWGPEGKERILLDAEADGAKVANYYPSGHILELWVDRGQLERLAAHDDVQWIDLWSAPENDMDLVRQDSGANFIETNFGTCGQGVRGEVLDGGLESTHMDFNGILLHGSNSAASHGTSTYGIVFGNGNRDGDGNAQGLGQLVCSSQGIAADYDFMTDRFAHTQQLKASPYFASFQSNSWGDALTTAYTSISNQMDDIIWRLDIAIVQSQSNAAPAAAGRRRGPRTSSASAASATSTPSRPRTTRGPTAPPSDRPRTAASSRTSTTGTTASTPRPPATPTPRVSAAPRRRRRRWRACSA